MPHLRIETNIPSSKIPQDFFAKVTPIIAKLLSRPEELCAVSVVPGLPMSFGGTTEPCGIANLLYIGVSEVEKNKSHSKVLFEFLEKELGIKSDRMFINFHTSLSSDVGYKGTTFHDIFK